MSRKSKKNRVGCFESLEERIVFSAEYFVDAIHGSDTNDGLSPTTALRSIERLVSQYDSLKVPEHIELSAGDTVTLMPGEHQFAYRYGDVQWQGLFLRNVHGTADKPITIRGMDGARINNRAPDGTEMFSIYVLQSSHIVVENLDVTAYGSAVVVADAADVVIRDNYIHDVDGIAANNLSGVYLTGVQRTVVENNLFTDNYDRSRPGNANNRHIVVFGGANVKILGNVMHNDDPNAGMAVDYKHLGGLPLGQVGQYEVAYNTIINAAGIGIGTAAPDSYIHHNLLIDSGSIRVADLGGTAQLANERIEYNTIINNLERNDGGGLSYFPTEYAGRPLGELWWSHNLLIDNRAYDHPEKSTILVDRYGPDEFYRRVFPGGLFHAEGNTYQTRDLARFDLYAAGGRYGELGSYLSFQQWQAAGYDRSGRVSAVQVDEYFRDQSSSSQPAGIYADAVPRLTAWVSRLDIDEAGDGSTARLRIVRSGTANSTPLRVKLAVSRDNELDVPREVFIPAGSDVIEVLIRGLPDSSIDPKQSIQISVTADGFNGASTWVRLRDTPADNSDDPVTTEGIYQVPEAAGQAVRLQSQVTRRWAEYNNEMGIAYVDDAQGRVGNLLPSDAGWTQALMTRGQHQTVLRSGVDEGDIGQIDLLAGRYFVFYLVQDATTQQWQTSNPSNDLGQKPLLFTSITNSNPDKFDHVRENNTVQSIELAWEDLAFGGDRSFTDLVVVNTFQFQPLSCGPIGQPTVDKEWTNRAIRSDVNQDGIVTALDALLVINALNQLGEVALPNCVTSEWVGLGAVDVTGDGRLTQLDAFLAIFDVISEWLVER